MNFYFEATNADKEADKEKLLQQTLRVLHDNALQYANKGSDPGLEAILESFIGHVYLIQGA